MPLHRTGVVAAVGAAGIAAAWAIRAGVGENLWVAEPISVLPPYTTASDTLGRNETLSELLGRHGIWGNDLHRLLASTQEQLNPRRVRAGKVLQLRHPRDADRPDRVRVELTYDTELWIERSDSGWVSRVESVPWRVERVKISGAIETSLWVDARRAIPASILNAQGRTQLVQSLGTVFDWVIDFSYESRPGDRFHIIAERLVAQDGRIRFGRILAAEVEVGGSPRYAFGLEGGDGALDFFDERGHSLKRMFLKAPVEFHRIASGFGGRRHPILKRWRNHFGTDYAASYGTPVRATADGVVVFAGRDGGYGNLVRIRHARSYETRYAHLRRFATGIRSNQRVRQGDTIGYVGATGLATGPHVHYEFRRGGRALDSRRVDLGDGTPVPATRRDEFTVAMRHYQFELGVSPAPPTAVAGGHDL